MKRFIALAAALAAIAICSEGNAQAQSRLHPGGFPYPGGTCQQGFGGGFGLDGFRLRREQPPFFAKFPPVYYSRAVKRPYGISPYAAPAGVAPVELNYIKPVPTNPVLIHNPHVKPESAMDAKVEIDAKVNVDKKPKVDTKVKANVTPEKNKTASWRVNPFFETQFALN